MPAATLRTALLLGLLAASPLSARAADPPFARVALAELPLPGGLVAGELVLDPIDRGGARLVVHDGQGRVVAEVRGALSEDEEEARGFAASWALAVAGPMERVAGAFGEPALASRAGDLLVGSHRGLAYVVRCHDPVAAGSAASLAAGLRDVADGAAAETGPEVLSLTALPPDGRPGIPLGLVTRGRVAAVDYQVDGGQVLRTAAGPRLLPGGGGPVRVTVTALAEDLRVARGSFVLTP
ncbi:hypothetical protein L6R50_25700 [Myxococcota bacterium]|nr:hypothetical protein [Myxococcota bacterium]